MSVVNDSGYKLFAIQSVNKVEEIFSSENVDTRIAERLFSSSLVATVWSGEQNKLKVSTKTPACLDAIAGEARSYRARELPTRDQHRSRFTFRSRFNEISPTSERGYHSFVEQLIKIAVCKYLLLIIYGHSSLVHGGT